MTVSQRTVRIRFGIFTTAVWFLVLVILYSVLRRFNLDVAFMGHWLPFIMAGSGLTVFVSVVSIVLAVILALLGALGRLSKNSIANGVSGFYISLIRGTPLLVQIYIWYLGLPRLNIILPAVPDFYVFPFILVFSVLGCILGTLLTKPEEDNVLKAFYRQVRPWGFWGPIHAKVVADDPGFQGNKDFKRDMFNVVVGIVWQTSMVVIPIYLIIEKRVSLFSAIAILVITSLILKKNWYDRLPEEGLQEGRS